MALLILLNMGCGYHFMSTSPIIFPEHIKSIHILKINNPTTDPRLPTEIRTKLIEEFSKRSPNIKYVNSEDAEGKLAIDIVDYSLQTDVENVEEQTLKSNLCMTIRSYLYKQDKLIWDSRNISQCESVSNNASDTEIKKYKGKGYKRYNNKTLHVAFK